MTRRRRAGDRALDRRRLPTTSGCSVVAEGIEEATQLDALTELGCEFGQGYHFARPQSGAEVETLLTSTIPA